MSQINRRFIGDPLCVSYRVPSPSGCVPGWAAGVVRAGFVFSPIGAPRLLSPTRPVFGTGLFLVHVLAGLIGISPVCAGLFHIGPVCAGLTGIMTISTGLFSHCACQCRAYR